MKRISLQKGAPGPIYIPCGMTRLMLVILIGRKDLQDNKLTTKTG